MIERLWRGWTAPEDADAYEELLREEVLPRAVREVDGCVGYAVSRRRPEDTDADDEVAFRTRIAFESMDAVRTFAGGDGDDARDGGDAAGDDVVRTDDTDALAPHERAHVPPAARALLVRWDDRAAHYDRLFDGDDGSSEA